MSIIRFDHRESKIPSGDHLISTAQFKPVLTELGYADFEYVGPRYWYGQPIRKPAAHRVRINGKPFDFLFHQIINQLKTSGYKFSRYSLRWAIYDLAQENWHSPEDKRVAAQTRPGPDGDPILTGYSKKPGEMHFRCPWCNGWHYHGWGKDSVLENRASHCSIYQGSYWIEVKK